MIKKNKWQLLISSIIILLPIVVGLLIWNYLPERIVTHWGFDGEPNRWSSKAFAIVVLPMILLFAHWVCVFFTARDIKNKDQSQKVFRMVLWIIPITSLIVCGITFADALGYDVSVDLMVRILLGIMFVMLGNYMPKCKQNRTIGIKIKWALRNEENWNKTHRFAGKLWFFGGILLLATMFVPMENLMNLFVLLMLLMVIVPIIYSYAYYRKQLKDGTASKDDALTPFEKKASKISLVIGIAILALAAIFLFTGKFEVQFGETSLNIDATYWDDAAVKYEDIDHVEYREIDHPGTRTFGYGTPSLLMGEFENSEFDQYTRYSYTSCDACVVLKVDEKILVINGTDEESTKEIYDELINRMNQ